MGSIWHTLAGLGGASAVAMGAYGAHGFKPVDKYYDTVFERANKYHFMGSFVLAIAPMMKRTTLIGSLAAAGLVGFSGSCYAVALTEDRSVGKLAPFGGFAFIAAWLAMAF
jgi:uncharacterized membrane protein YgdD (TMEM256/DUF423 family)